MGIHSKWTTGGLEFYNTGTTYTAFKIPNVGQEFAVGQQGLGYDFYFYGATTGSYMLWDEGGDRLNFYAADLNLYGSSGTEIVGFDSSNSHVDFSGWNITYNNPIVTHSTGVGSSGMVTLTPYSNRRQFLGPTTGTGNLMVKLPATSESQGIEFLIWNLFSTGGGQDPASGLNIVVATTGMGATTGTIIRTIVTNNYAKFYADGQTWRSELGAS